MLRLLPWNPLFFGRVDPLDRINFLAFLLFTIALTITWAELVGKKTVSLFPSFSFHLPESYSFSCSSFKPALACSPWRNVVWGIFLQFQKKHKRGGKATRLNLLGFLTLKFRFAV